MIVHQVDCIASRVNSWCESPYSRLVIRFCEKTERARALLCAMLAVVALAATRSSTAPAELASPAAAVAAVAAAAASALVAPAARRPFWAHPSTSPSLWCAQRKEVSCGKTRAQTLRMCPLHVDPLAQVGSSAAHYTHARVVTTPLFLLEDIFALGHMQMSFAALWSHLTGLRAGSELLVSFQFGHASEVLSMAGVIREYYLPLLRSIQA